MTPHKKFSLFASIILCTGMNTIFYAQEQLIIYTKVIGQEKVKNDAHKLEYTYRISKINNDLIVINNKRYFTDDEGSTWYPLLTNASTIQCAPIDYNDTYELKNKHFIEHDGKNYRVTLNADIYCIGANQYTLNNNKLTPLTDQVSLQAEEEEEIGYESEEETEKGLTHPSSNSASSSSTTTTAAVSSSSSTSTTTGTNPTISTTQSQHYTDLSNQIDAIKKTLNNTSNIATKLQTRFTTLDKNVTSLATTACTHTNLIQTINTEIQKLKDAVNASNAQDIELSTLCDARAIENSYLRLQTQSRFEKACDFFAAAGTLALPVLRLAPCIAPLMVPSVVTYGAAISCATGLAYWAQSLSKRTAAINAHNRKINFNNNKVFPLTSQYMISMPYLTSLRDRLYDFTAASCKIIGLAGAGAALCMLAHKNKASMPTI